MTYSALLFSAFTPVLDGTFHIISSFTQFKSINVSRPVIQIEVIFGKFIAHRIEWNAIIYSSFSMESA